MPRGDNVQAKPQALHGAMLQYRRRLYSADPRRGAGFLASGRPDLNRGPRRPERRALPGCATPRWGLSLAARARRQPVSPPTAPVTSLAAPRTVSVTGVVAPAVAESTAWVAGVTTAGTACVAVSTACLAVSTAWVVVPETASLAAPPTCFTVS